LAESLTFDYLKRAHVTAPNGNSSVYWIDAEFIEELRAEAWGGER
jgi:hypothetical protein